MDRILCKILNDEKVLGASLKALPLLSPPLNLGVIQVNGTPHTREDGPSLLDRASRLGRTRGGILTPIPFICIVRCTPSLLASP